MKEITFSDDLLGKITVHGIGKIIIESKNDFNIPHLHFITYFSEQEKTYNTLCLELGIHFMGNDYQPSIKGMLNGCFKYLNTTIIQKEDIDKLISIVSSKDFEDFWVLYRRFEFEAAKEKRDISAKFIQEIKRQAFVEFADKTFVPTSVEYNFPKKVA